MKVLSIIGVVIALGLAALLGLAAMKPDTFRISRSVSVNAPPDKIYPLIADVKGFNTWNPFAKKDPGHAGSYSGPSSGVGAKYAWNSDALGVGSMTVAELTPPTKVLYNLDFEKPFAAKNLATFTIEPKGSGSEVTWAMTGPRPYLAKIIHTVVDVDSMVGGDFEKGLADLKAIAERP